MTFDPDDDSILHLLHRGKPVSFELDKVFSPRASQQDVSAALGWRGVWGEGMAEPHPETEKWAQNGWKN